MNADATPQPDAIGHDAPARGRAWVWPAIIVGMLATHTLGCLFVVYLVSADTSHSVIPDYHAKAVAWDEHRARERANAELGWSCQVVAANQADMMGQRSVRISLRDAADEPLAGAAVTLSLFHHARANDVVEAELREGAPGEYVGMIDMRKDGLWRFDVEARRGEDTFTAGIDQQVGPRLYYGGGAP